MVSRRLLPPESPPCAPRTLWGVSALSVANVAPSAPCETLAPSPRRRCWPVTGVAEQSGLAAPLNQTLRPHRTGSSILRPEKSNEPAPPDRPLGRHRPAGSCPRPSCVRHHQRGWCQTRATRPGAGAKRGHLRLCHWPTPRTHASMRKCAVCRLRPQRPRPTKEAPAGAGGHGLAPTVCSGSRPFVTRREGSGEQALSPGWAAPDRNRNRPAPRSSAPQETHLSPTPS